LELSLVWTTSMPRSAAASGSIDALPGLINVNAALEILGVNFFFEAPAIAIGRVSCKSSYDRALARS
jgi:hypothetical protein